MDSRLHRPDNPSGLLNPAVAMRKRFSPGRASGRVGRARAVVEVVALLAVLGFVAAVAYLPHADRFANPPPEGLSTVRLAQVYWDWLGERRTDDYEHTIHVDENVHWGKMQDAQRQETLRGEGATALDLRGLVHERGFHVALAYLQTMTGLPWHELFRFLPALWAAVTALVLWAALRPSLAAWPAAAFAALVPTSARFLGPGFLVPIGLGLAWIAAVLLLTPHVAKRPRAAPLLLVVLLWGFFVHLMVGIAGLLLVLCTLPFVKGTRKGMAVLAGTALLPIVALSQVFADDVGREASILQTLPLDFAVYDQLGVPFLLLWGLGAALVAARPPLAGGVAVRAATLASIAVFVIMLVNILGNLGLYALYDRWHQVFALLACVPAGHGLAVLAEEALALLRRWSPARSALRPTPAALPSAALAVLLLAGVVASADEGLRYHIGQPYYHVLDDDDWAAYVWVAGNVGPDYEVFLAHPWKAPILAALTGMEPYTYLSPGSPPFRGEVYDAYVAGQLGSVGLVQRDISLVVVFGDLGPGPEFVRIHPRVWALDPALARELAQLRAT